MIDGLSFFSVWIILFNSERLKVERHREIYISLIFIKKLELYKCGYWKKKRRSCSKKILVDYSSSTIERVAKYFNGSYPASVSSSGLITSNLFSLSEFSEKSMLLLVSPSSSSLLLTFW